MRLEFASFRLALTFAIYTYQIQSHYERDIYQRFLFQSSRSYV